MKLLTTDILRILKALEPYECRLVGGCVRDYIAFNIRADDIDIATTAKPDIVIKTLKKAGMHVIPTGLKHGTVTCIYKHKTYEITTLRQDIKTDGRHAEVIFTEDYYKDSLRRDFTFNALYMDDKGYITDYHNGQGDLKNAYVKFIGNPIERIEEDYLRILRYFRFHGKFTKKPKFEPEILNIIQEKSPQLEKISKERITQEVFKILNQPHCLFIWNTMQKTHTLNSIGLTSTPPTQFPYKKKEFESLKALAKLIILIPKESHILKTFALSNAQKKFIQKTIYAINTINLEMDILPQAYTLGYDETLSALKIMNLKSTQHNHQKLIKNLEAESLPTFPLKGADLIELGYKPSPQLGKTIKKIESWWLNNNFPSKETCLNFLKSLDK